LPTATGGTRPEPGAIHPGEIGRGVKTRSPRIAMLAAMETTSCYRVTIRGSVSERLAAAFEDVRLEPADGATVLVGALRDQAELYGLLNRLRDFGLELVRVEEVRL
jgi:hypothetical protein